MNLLSNNTMNVRPSDPQFDLLTNRCDYFEIGEAQGADVWLQGDIVGPGGEFLFNGRLFCRQGGLGTVIDSFPKADVPAGWSKHPKLEAEGYELRDAQGEVVFGYEVTGNVCKVTLGLYNANGALVAGAGQGGLLLEGLPALIGRGGIRFG